MGPKDGTIFSLKLKLISLHFPLSGLQTCKGSYSEGALPLLHIATAPENPHYSARIDSPCFVSTLLSELHLCETLKLIRNNPGHFLLILRRTEQKRRHVAGTHCFIGLWILWRCTKNERYIAGLSRCVFGKLKLTVDVTYVVKSLRFGGWVIFVWEY